MKAAVIAVSLLAGCVAPPPPVDLAELERRAGPRPQNLEPEIRRWMRDQLRDPDSVRDLTIGEPYAAQCIYSSARDSRYAWSVPADFNAKNAYGGYTGRTRYYFWFHNDRLLSGGRDPRICP